MSKDEKKKVLYVIGMDHKLERFIKEEAKVNPENMIILQRYQPVIPHPFDELMRDIIIAVFQENVEEIVVAFTDDYQKDTEDMLIKINKNKELNEKIQTLDYLFKNTKPEFPKGTVSDWLQGGKTLMDSVKKTVHIIRHHPLLPSHLKVKVLFIEQQNEKLSKIV
ncbi:carbonic anhydrase [Neobacillus cucumis]|uniref:Carbonic anhydrase n=1 Tax=Neobacillus cucumis TaxID=1740721 RepID=A0A2N5HJT8_9BACI|nr:carbonic anhydrase [Neobacillus cucumis]PLS05764.1 carbonic anhydrase [Neobacillus cucumis]